jgi:signal transduction histidine kinase
VVGLGVDSPAVWPLLIVSLGVVLLWRQADEAQRTRWRAAAGADRRIGGVVRTVLGVLLVVGGAAVFLVGPDMSASIAVLLPTAVIVVGVALVSGPWWVRMARELAGERAARIRAQERAEITAHLHDSVLHTLTLIQRSVDNPREVARLARAQERELRGWLYRSPGRPGATFAAELERIAAEVEDEHGVTVEVVVVGDCTVDEHVQPVLLATREALVNAAKYAGEGTISVYAEVQPDQVSLYVRDHGPGFQVATVPPDRLGVRQSIVGRVERAGGRAAVLSSPGEGTEVQLELPRSRP